MSMYDTLHIAKLIRKPTLLDILKILLTIVVLATIIFYMYRILRTKSFTNTYEGLYLPDVKLDIPEPTGKEPPTDISYQIPIPANQLQDTNLRDIDTDILRNVRVLANFSKTDELDFYQMYAVIKQLKGQRYNFNFDKSAIETKSYLISSQNTVELSSGAIKKANLELYTRIKLELISALNRLILDNNLYTKYHSYTFFKIIGSNLVALTEKSPDVQNWIFQLKIGREYKYIQFTLYFDIDVIKGDISGDGNNYTVVVNKIEVLGIPIPNDIVFHENNKTTDKPELAQDTSNVDMDVMPVSEGMFKNADTKFIDPIEVADMSPNYFDNDSLASKIEDRIMALAKDLHISNHKCFALVDGKSAELPYYKWPAFCESYHPEVNQNGIWDAPCQIDSDCPFYQANKNYPNEFGKCDKDTGKCQMPQGVIPLGFTRYAKQEPDCYNCGMSSMSNKCCGQQAADIKSGKVAYKSPDYIFEGDFQLRKQNADLITSRGLKVNPSI